MGAKKLNAPPVDTSNHFAALESLLPADVPGATMDNNDIRQGNKQPNVCGNKPVDTPTPSRQEKMVAKVERKKRRKAIWRAKRKEEEQYLDGQIDIAEDERTDMAKNDPNSVWKNSITKNHILHRPNTGLRQSWRNTGYAVRSAIRKAKRFLARGHTPTVSFTTVETRWFQQTAHPQVFEKREPPCTLAALAVARTGRWFKNTATKVFATFDTGADGNYITEKDRQKLQLPITGDSDKRVSVANGHVEQGKHKTELPLKELSPPAKVDFRFLDFFCFIFVIEGTRRG